MPSDVVVRPFQPRDQEAARALVLEGLGEHFGFIDETKNPDLDDIAANFPGAGHAFFVAEDAGTGEVVGTTGLLIEPPEYPGEARIVRMSVAAERRRAGIASALLGACVAETRTRGLASLVVYTEPHWDAPHFYRGAGFAQFGADEEDIWLRLLL